MSRASDLSEQRFGFWTASKISRLEDKKDSRYKVISWQCICDCGITKFVDSRSLQNGKSTNCGCMRRKPTKSFIGMTFGLWKVLSASEGYWICECKCGTVREVYHGSLNSNKSKSCGCVPFEKVNQLKYGEASLNMIIKSYKKRIKKSNKECDLTNDEFKHLFSSNCNTEPNQIARRSNYFGEFKGNGIDRINSSVGYIKTNCRTCCKWCNFAKNTMSESELYAWVIRINKNLQNKGII